MSPGGHAATPRPSKGRRAIGGWSITAMKMAFALWAGKLCSNQSNGRTTAGFVQKAARCQDPWQARGGGASAAGSRCRMISPRTDSECNGVSSIRTEGNGACALPGWKLIIAGKGSSVGGCSPLTVTVGDRSYEASVVLEISSGAQGGLVYSITNVVSRRRVQHPTDVHVQLRRGAKLDAPEPADAGLYIRVTNRSNVDVSLLMMEQTGPNIPGRWKFPDFTITFFADSRVSKWVSIALARERSW